MSETTMANENLVSAKVKVAGLRELDLLVAVRVLGWAAPKRREAGATWTMPSGAGASEGAIPRYSSDIAAAWEVVERMRADHFFSMQAKNLTLGEPVCASFARDGASGHAPMDVFTATADSAPAAICLAALAAKGITVELSAALDTTTKETL